MSTITTKIFKFTKLKRLIKYYYIDYIKYTKKDLYIPRSEYEKEVIGICRRITQNPRSELLTCPQTGKRYIKNNELQIYAIIKQNGQVDIINHKYFYSIPLCPKSYSIILNMFDGHVGMRRQDMENDIMANTKNSLVDIYDKVRMK